MKMLSYFSWNIDVPGSFSADAVFLDIETRKVRIPGDGYQMANGEILRNRWEAFLIGIAMAGEIILIEGADPLTGLSDFIPAGSEIRYGATREFDEMILRGRFTNARRAHAPEPFYPAVDGAESFRWVNVGPAKSNAERAADVPSRDVPAEWKKGDVSLVMIHNLRDVCDLILVAGSPDAICEEWCRDILSSDDAARVAIFPGSDF